MPELQTQITSAVNNFLQAQNYFTSCSTTSNTRRSRKVSLHVNPSSEVALLWKKVSQFIMVALWNTADHYIFILSFVLSSFFLFSSPNLSGRRLDVCHTSTHVVALVRIQDAGLKRAARGSLEMQDAKIAKVAICAPSYNFLGLYLRN